MKYDFYCRFINLSFSYMLKDYYKHNNTNLDYKKIIKAVKKEYKAMILRTPGAGKHNQMASNVKGAAYFFSMAHAIPNMNVELMDSIINYAFTSDLMVKSSKKEKETGSLFSDKAMDKLEADSKRSQASAFDMDFKYTFIRGNGEYKMNITKCAVKRLAEVEGLMEYLPSMCKMDYPKYALKGAKLVRTKTLANGDDCCDFHLIRDKSI